MCFVKTQAQVVSTGTISGKVVDASNGKPIPLANVFITGTTLGAGANEQGMFEIKNVPFGDHYLVASILGYEPQSVHIRLAGSLKSDIVFRLQQKEIPMPGVEVVGEQPKEWKKNLEKFQEVFLGSTDNAAKCKILNPEVLDFRIDPDTKLLYATARKPLEIENTALGYRFQYHLREFEAGKNSIKFGGFTKFDELTPQNEAERKEWEEQRRRAYNGSLQHFLAMLVQGKVKEEGFFLRMVSWPDRNYGTQIILDSQVKLEKLISAGELSNERKFAFSNFLEVSYTREEPEHGYWRFMRMRRLATKLVGGETNVRDQISLIEMNAPVVVINVEGYMSDPFALTTYGYWSYERVADMLPLDYKPKKN
ncbi:MAG: carboxypeptidase-like regulatory domain-containing protein [Ignavibacteriales bacterium]|nr:carboxypeptidase-like regulatory domain-containing protein [Ignavibacteriales bacterium]